MELKIENFRDIKVQQIDPGKFIDEKRWSETVVKLTDLKLFIDEMIRIINTKQQIPQNLILQAKSFAEGFLSYLKQITEDTKGQPAEIANRKDQLLRQFDGWYKECIEKTNNRPEQLSFYETFNTLKNLEKNNYENELIEINNIKNKILSDKESIDSILKELQKKTSSVTMSDYAKIFGNESKSHNRSSWIWLVIGIILSFSFLSILLFSNWYDKFSTEDVLANGTIRINISNILIKLLIFAVQVFLISFSFKQYSISRHLSTINKHRQNGLDSYKLFIESISKDNAGTRDTLMLQLAKAIYEQTSTGYIGDKDQINSGILEITKMIGENKN